MRTPTLAIRQLCLTCLVSGLSFQAVAAPPSSSPATVTKESDLVILTLTEEGESRLRLKVHPITKRVLSEVRKFAGQVITPLGPEGAGVTPFINGNLAEQRLLADQQAIADGLILEANVNVEAATIALRRAEKVRLADAGSTRAVDEANAALQLAEARQQTAQIRRGLLGDSITQATRSKRTWVRVAVYTGEVSLLDSEALASVQTIGAPNENFKATPIVGPSTADAIRGTVDWYFKFEPNVRLRPGEQVSVTIPTKSSATEHLVIPFNAVLHDIHGGQWIYERVKDHVYTRRRVQVSRIDGTDAVLTSGPAPGSQIVTDGATELFGAEFMTGK